MTTHTYHQPFCYILLVLDYYMIANLEYIAILAKVVGCRTPTRR